MDLASTGLSLLSVLAVIYGIKQTAQDGLGSLPAFSILVGLALGVVFVRKGLLRNLGQPLVSPLGLRPEPGRVRVLLPVSMLFSERTQVARWCASRAPVTPEASGRLEMSTDFHGLSVAVCKTAGTRTEAAP